MSISRFIRKRLIWISIPLLACNALAQGVDTKSITMSLGGIFPVSGVMADGGVTTQAFLMAVEAVNADPHYTFRIEPFTADSQTNAEAAIQAAQAMADSGVNAIIGGVTSVVSASIATEVAGPRQIPQLSPTASASRLSDKSVYPYFLRLLRGDTEAEALANIPIQFGAVATILKLQGTEGLNVSRVALLEGADAYSSDVSDQVEARLTQNGIVVERHGIDAASDLTLGDGIDLVYLIALNSDAVQAMNRIGDNNYHWIISASIANQAFADSIANVQRGPLFAVDAVGGRGILYQRFLETWCERENADPDCPEPVFWTPLTYDAVKVYAEAVQGLLDDGVAPEAVRGERLLNAMAAVQLMGLAGSIGFDENLDRASVLYKVSWSESPNANLVPSLYWTGDAFSPEEFEFVGTIKIGATVSLTGRFAVEGNDVRQGYDTWLDWVNHEKGGVQIEGQRYGVEMVYYDDESSAALSADQIEALITHDQVQFLLGPYSSGITLAASEVSESHGVIMVQGNGADEGLFERGHQNLFAVLTPAGEYTQSALEILSQRGAKTVVIAYEEDPFSQSVAEGAQRWALEYGLQVLQTASYPPNVGDVSEMLTSFKALNPDLFVGGGHFQDALLLVQTAKALDFNPKAMVLTVGPSNPDFVEQLQGDANYILGPTQWEAVMAYEDPWFGTARDYALRYEALWNEPPTYQAAQSTAAGLALMLAIEQAGALETEAVRSALRQLDVDTFYGPIQFDATGKNVEKPMGTIQIQNGSIKVVAPALAAERNPMYPAPTWEEREKSALRITNWSILDNRLIFQWLAASPGSYTIELNTRLNGGTWIPLGVLDHTAPNPANYSFEYFNPIEPGSMGYFRIRLLTD